MKSKTYINNSLWGGIAFIALGAITNSETFARVGVTLFVFGFGLFSGVEMQIEEDREHRQRQADNRLKDKNKGD